LIAKVPIDLMDGKPLRYRLQPDGDYLLYSSAWTERMTAATTTASGRDL